MAKVSDRFAEATVLDPKGGVHTLSSLWAERPVVLVFIRHFG